MRLFAPIVLILTFAPALVNGQTAADGSLRGYVRDEQGAVVAQAQVRITREAAETYETTSDADGYYRLLNLPAGRYTLTAEHSGFAKFVRENIQVRPGLNIGLEITLTVAAVTEAVEVVSETPMLEVLTATQAVNTSGEFQRALPLEGRRNFASFLFLTPGAVNEQRAVFVHGSTFDSQVVQVEGMDISSNQQSVSWYVQFSTEALEDVQVKTAAIDASAPPALGGVINIATRSGTNNISGAVGAVFQSKQWTGSNEPGGVPSRVGQVQTDAALGGPLMRDRWWLFGSHRFTDFRRDANFAADRVAILKALVPGWTQPDSLNRDNYYFVKTNAQLGTTHQLMAFYQRDKNLSLSAYDAGRFGGDNTGGDAVAARLSSAWSPSWLTRLAVSYNNKGLDWVSDYVDVTATLVHRDAFLSGGALRGSGTIAALDSVAYCCYDQPYSRATIALDATHYRRGWFGSHDLQAGIYLQPRMTAKSSAVYNNNGFNLQEVVLRDPSNPSAGYVAFHQEIYDDGRVLQQDILSENYAMYVQDAWRPIDRLTIGAGVRVDWIKDTDRLFDEVTKDTRAIGPRVSLNYRVSPKGRDIVRASWSRIFEVLTRGRATLGSANTGVRNLYDNDLDGVFETEFYTPGSTQAAPDRVIDLHRRHPYVDEWTLGYQRQLRNRLAFDVGFVRREFRSRALSYDINGIYENGVFRGYGDERFNTISYVTHNTFNWPVYNGLTFTVTRNSGRAQLLATYTNQWNALKGTWVPNDPASFIQPDAFPTKNGIGDTRTTPSNSLTATSDVSNRQWKDSFRVGASWTGPWRMLLGVSYTAHEGEWSGAIRTRVPAADPRFGPSTVRLSNGRVVSNPLATTTRFKYPTRGEGQLQLPWVHLVNLRVGREFRFGDLRWQAAVDAYNVLNSGDFMWFRIGGNEDYSPNFNLGRQRPDPRSAQLSIRATF